MLRLPRFRAFLAALIATVAIGIAPAAYADSGTIWLTIYKGGWIIGGQAGNGQLTFHGRRYRLGVGGASIGFTFGGAKAMFQGRVSHIRRPSDVEGVYAAASAGGALVRGAGTVILKNDKGAVLELDGRQVGLMVNVDLSGMAITLK